MASQYTGDDQKIGILIHDERVTLATLTANEGNADGSDYTEHTPRPGVPTYAAGEVATGFTPTRGPLASVDALGEQSGTTSYTIKATEPGMPGLRAQVVQRPSLNTAEKWRGHNTANVLEWFLQDEHIQVDAAAGADTRIGSCRTLNDRVCWVYVKSTQLIEAVVYDPETHTINTPVTVADFSADPNVDEASMPEADTNVDVVQGRDGRLLAYYLTRQVDPVASATIRIGWAYSDDNGENWRTGGVHVVDTKIPNTWPTSTPFTRLRAAYHNGQVLILLHWQPVYTDGQGDPASLAVDVWLQLASDDDGATFKLVDSGIDHVTGNNPNAGPLQLRSEIVVDRATGIFTVIYQRNPGGGASETISYKRIASPFEVLHHVAATTISTISTDATDLSAWEGEDGRLYFAWVADLTSGNHIEMSYSRNGGATWINFGADPAAFNHPSGPNPAGWTRVVIAEAGGRAIWAGCDETFAYAAGNRYMIVGSGGWCTVEQPRGSRTIDDYPQNFGWGLHTGSGFDAGTWYPPQLPTAQQWTKNGAGAEAITSPSPWEVVLTSTANAISYSKADATRRATWQLKLDTAGSTLAKACAVEINDANFDVSVRFKSDTIAIYDEVGVPAQKSTVAIDTSVARVYLLAVGWASGTAYAVLYSRLPESDDYAAILVSSWASAAASGSGKLIEWGNIASGTETSRWGYFHNSEFAGDTENRDALWRRDITTHAPLTFTGTTIPAPPYKVYIDAGLKLQGTSGPFVVGDTWQVEPHSDYPADVIVPAVAPSPRRVHRTVNTAATVRYVWNVDADTDTSFGITSYGIAVSGINWRTGRLRGWNGAAWSTIVDIDAAIDFQSCSYTRAGNQITVNAAAAPFAAGARWIHYNEFAGSTIKLSGSKLRRIRSNTEGAWTSSTTKRPTFILEGVDGTEPVSGDCEIWATSAVALTHENTALYRRYSLEVQTQNTVDGYLQTGSAIIGPVVFLGQRYDWGRNVSLEQSLEVSDTRDGHRRVRQNAPARRVMSAAWSAGVSQAPIGGAAPDPQWIAMLSGGAPVAARGDQPTLIEGLTRRLSGRLGVIIPRIDDIAPAGVTQLAGGQEYMLGRMLGQIETVAVLGDERRDELTTVAGLQWQEEV